MWGSEPPDPCWIHHCTVYILKLLSHYKIAIPYYTNSLGFIRSQQLVNNIQSMVRKERKETVFGCVKCSKHYFSFIYLRPSCSSWYQYCWGVSKVISHVRTKNNCHNFPTIFLAESNNKIRIIWKFMVICKH